MARKVFISHSHADGQAVTKLKSALIAAGCEAWVSTEQIDQSKPFPPPIARAIVASDALFLYLTSKARQSSWVQSEVLFALRNNTPIVVLEVEPLPGGHPLALSLDQAAITIKRRSKSERAFFAEVIAALGSGYFVAERQGRGGQDDAKRQPVLRACGHSEQARAAD